MQLIGSGLEATQLALGAFRSLILFLMLAAYIYVQRPLLKDTGAICPERARLGSNDYAAIPGYGTIDQRDDVKVSPKAKDSQSSGWLSYFIGFRVLFPYIW